MYTIDVSIKDHFFRWEGRLNRLRYIKRTLIIIALSIALYLITMTAVFLLLAQTGGNNTALNPIQGMLFAWGLSHCSLSRSTSRAGCS